MLPETKALSHRRGGAASRIVLRSGAPLALAGQNVIRQLRNKSFEQIHRLSVSYYTEHEFGDVMSRQLQGAIMLRKMTGVEVATEKKWLVKVLDLIDPADGLLHRPDTSYSKAVADWGDNALTLYALATAAIESGDTRLRSIVVSMVEGLMKITSDETLRRSLIDRGYKQVKKFTWQACADVVQNVFQRVLNG